MYNNYSLESLKYRHMFRPDDDTDSGDSDLMMDGDTIGLEYDDEEEGDN